MSIAPQYLSLLPSLLTDMCTEVDVSVETKWYYVKRYEKTETVTYL